MQALTERQQAALDYIRHSIQTMGYPPTLREIAAHMGIRSTNGVNDHLRALERKGYLARQELKSRGMRLVGPAVQSEEEPATEQEDGPPTEATVTLIPVVGRVAAGQPLVAEQQVLDHIPVERALTERGPLFGLRVRGDSMIEAGILDGDTVIVRNRGTAQRGDIVVALLGDEATIKYYHPERDYVRFQPANAAMAPILVRTSDMRPTMLLGVVVGVQRRLH